MTPTALELELVMACRQPNRDIRGNCEMIREVLVQKFMDMKEKEGEGVVHKHQG